MPMIDCYCGKCDYCHDRANRVYELQHPIKICTGCGLEENHQRITYCATCQARFQELLRKYMGDGNVSAYTHNGAIMVYGLLRQHCPTAYVDVPFYLSPLEVETIGYAYIQFKPINVVSAFEYVAAGPNSDNVKRLQITIKL